MKRGHSCNYTWKALECLLKVRGIRRRVFSSHFLSTAGLMTSTYCLLLSLNPSGSFMPPAPLCRCRRLPVGSVWERRHLHRQDGCLPLPLPAQLWRRSLWERWGGHAWAKASQSSITMLHVSAWPRQLWRRVPCTAAGESLLGNSAVWV